MMSTSSQHQQSQEQQQNQPNNQANTLDLDDPLHSSDDDQQQNQNQTDKLAKLRPRNHSSSSDDDESRRKRGVNGDRSQGGRSQNVQRSRSRSPIARGSEVTGDRRRRDRRGGRGNSSDSQQSSDLNEDNKSSGKSESDNNMQDEDQNDNDSRDGGRRRHHRYRSSRERAGGNDRDRRYGRRGDQSQSSSTRIKMPPLDAPLVTFKEFIQMQRGGESFSHDDAQRLYDHYKADHIDKQAEIFFTMHKDECWFREKYDPQQSYKWKQEIVLQAQSVSSKFIEEFVEVGHGTEKSQKLSLDEDPNFDYQKLVNPNTSAETDEVSGPPLFGFDANSRTLYLKQIPVKISRWELLSHVRQTRGFVSFSMSEPLKTQDFERYAWVSYDSEENCRRAKDQLDGQKVQDFKLYPVKSQTQRKPIRITPPLAEDSINRDFNLCKRLITEVFNQEKQISASQSIEKLLEVCQFLNQTQQLDLLILYLRRVHAYCFYCGEEYDDERMLAAKCGPQHIRSAKKITRFDLDNLGLGGLYSGSKSFEDKYLKAANDRLLKGIRELVAPEQDKLLIEMKTKYSEKKTVEVNEGHIYQCAMCEKRFKTPDFVEKHIFNKHGEELDKKFNKLRFEDMLKENYMSDPNKFINTYNNIGGGGYGGRGGYDRYHNNSAADRRMGGGDRRRYGDGGRGDYGGDRGEDRRGPRKEYIDYDDPNNAQNAAKVNNPERQLVSYDDLF